MERYVCVHGHFYQPPRENPWLETVEQQDSAWPYHDWNERITAECYAPNAAARILDDHGRLSRLVSNYARMSFNVGPTLLAWLAEHDPASHDAIVASDAESAGRFGGHGSAMAQVYNHLIMPLANRRDQRTQVVWGIADFRHRFGREPEGMWLAETAVDLPTLELLAEHGVRYTVLSPYQALRTRARRGAWRDARGGAVDPTRPYVVRLGSGRRIAVFFYDGPISRAVAFERLLNSGEAFANRLLTGFHDGPGPQLVNIATDGESYGHHHRYGEMALAHALQLLDGRDDVTLTNYGEYLERFPPTHEAEIVENSAWSCAHGVERWRSDCGCSTGEGAGYHQAWREPLRDALDWLRDELAERWEDRARRLLAEPWAARDDYIEVLLDRSEPTLTAFLERHARHRPDERERRDILRLLELQRHALLMYTSCGWFFDELSRIETVQVLHYAARALQLAGDLFGERQLEGAFLDRLAKAPSNVAELGDGRVVYERLVVPSVADLDKVAAHFAISGLFRRWGPTELIGCYEVDREDEHESEAGRARLAHGRGMVRSTITQEQAAFEYGVLHFGDHNFACGVRPRGDDEHYDAMAAELTETFAKADFPDAVRRLDAHFGTPGYSLGDLFLDEQRRILGVILDSTVTDTEATFRGIYRSRAPLMRFLMDLGAHLPAALRHTAEVVINAELRHAFERPIDPPHVRSLIVEAERFGVHLDERGLAHALDRMVQRSAERIDTALAVAGVFDQFDDRERAGFAGVGALIEVAGLLPFEVELGKAQEQCYRVVRRHRPELQERSDAGDHVAREWLEHLDAVGASLRVAPASEEERAGTS